MISESTSCCISCNVLKKYGWHPFQNEYEFMGKIIEDKLGDKDATFLDVSTKIKCTINILLIFNTVKNNKMDFT
jgi:hypothetical protein